MQQAGWRWQTESGLPDEVGAVAAESRLLEEPGCEFMVLHFVDVLLPQGTFSSKPVRYVLGGRLDQTYICHRVLLYRYLSDFFPHTKKKYKKINATALFLLRSCVAQSESSFCAPDGEPESEAEVLTGDAGLTGSEGFPCLSLLH